MQGRRSCTSPRTGRKAIGYRWFWNRKRPKNEKGPTNEGPCFAETWAIWNLDPGDVLGLQSLGPLLHLELYLRAFVQGTIAVCLDSRKVYEHVIAAAALDETIACGGVKPFHGDFFSHYFFSLFIFCPVFKKSSKKKKLRAEARSSLDFRWRGTNNHFETCTWNYRRWQSCGQARELSNAG